MAVEDEELDEAPRVPRRTRFATPRRPWWRPQSTFGQILLGTTVLFVLGGLLASAIVTRRFLTHDPHFRIAGASSIQSSGLSEVNRADVLPVFGEDIGRNIFFVPLHERRKQLEAVPWVRQATVMRFLPNRLSVSIVERTPVAFVRQGSQVELADADGVILSMPPAMMAQHHYSFPVLTGIDAKDSLASRRARMVVYQRFLTELNRNNLGLADQVSEIDLSDPEDLRAVMPEQGSDILAHFGDDHFFERMQRYKSQIGRWRSVYPRLIGVDLRYEGETPLEMATGADPSAGGATPAAAKPIAPLKSGAAKSSSGKSGTAKASTAKASTVKHKPAKPKTHAVHAVRQG